MKLNPKETKIKYPKSVEKLKEYLTRGYEELKIPKELQSQVNPDQLVNLSIIGMRGLYEFFDEWGVYIEIAFHAGKFGYGIGERDGEYPSLTTDFTSRLEAEKAAFETAFEELEKRLNNESN